MPRQMPMALDDCSRCGRPILPGEQYKQTAWVDIIEGRVVSSNPKACHLDRHCTGDATTGAHHAFGEQPRFRSNPKGEKP